MKPYTASLLNAVALIAMGLWGYFDTKSNTAFISVAFGAALLLCNSGLRKENKTIAHVAVMLTFLVLLVYLGRLLPKALEAGEMMKTVRTIIPIATGAWAMVAFIKSFIAARKARANA
jgi:uncharacterized membrane protein (UPF0136 family)